MANEGAELRRTVESVRENTRQPHEIVLVDDGSTDGSCDGLDGDDLTVIRHEERTGVAPLRNHGCAVAGGDVFAFLDGHQRLSNGCLDRCADATVERGAIVWPDVRGLEDRGWTGHGASLKLCDKHGYFGAQWHRCQPAETLSEISALVVPGYVMPREKTPSRDPMHNCSFPSGDALRSLITAEPSLDAGSIREDVGVLARGCRELRLLVQKRIDRKTSSVGDDPVG